MSANRYSFLDIPLNFPVFEFNIQEQDGRLCIFDPLRKRFLVLTPEEWVRQHMIAYLIQHQGFPRSLFALEKGLKYNQMLKRFDILVLDRLGAPFLLLECKAPEIQLSKKTLEQVATYNKKIEAPYLGISNGRQHLFFGFEEVKGIYAQLGAVPQIHT
jgi:hypothetical protein